ncbi:hypothetical protein N7451_012750 [Penicillium sp. IBT 35674x]|nr:hypothetical protein N7451_012750 [Penicillium sp. IBT 35674x]
MRQLIEEDYIWQGPFGILKDITGPLGSGVKRIFSIGSSLLGVTFQEIQSFENQPKDIGHLKSELNSLIAVLKPLLSVVSESSAENDPDLVSLKAPLLGCGEACKDLGGLVQKCTKHSHGKKSSVRDWAMLKLLADQIKGAQNVLSMYRTTITLALANANLRRNRVTQEVFEKYNGIILEITSQLKEHIRQVDDRLSSLPLQGATKFSGKEELERLLREKLRVKQCLDVCRQIAETINRGQSAVVQDVASPTFKARYTSTKSLNEILSADETTMNFLDHLSLSTKETCEKLEKRGQFVQQKLEHFPAAVLEEFEEVFAERCQRQNERTLLIGCLSVCENASQRSEQARISIFEDIHAAKRAKQAVISEVGDLLSAKGIRADEDSEQILGQVSRSPFVNFNDGGINRKPAQQSPGCSSQDLREGYQSRNVMSLGRSALIYDLRNLLFVVLIVVAIRNV